MRRRQPSVVAGRLHGYFYYYARQLKQSDVDHLPGYNFLDDTALLVLPSDEALKYFLHVVQASEQALINNTRKHAFLNNSFWASNSQERQYPRVQMLTSPLYRAHCQERQV